MRYVLLLAGVCVMLLGMFAPRGAPAPSAAPFFNSDPMLSSGWEPVSYPSGFYDATTDRTYVAWQFVGASGGYKGVHAAYYDHTTGAWSERYKVGNFQLANDDHGHPAMVRDADGYIHAFYGSHGNPQKYSVTNAVDDISAWTQRPNVGSALTYPKPVLVGSTIWLFARDHTDTNNRKLSVLTMTPAAGVGTWSSVQPLVEFGASSRTYTSETHLRGTDIHFICAYAPIADGYRKGVYYFVLDTTTGNISNYDGSVTVLAASRPVTKAQADADFLVFDHGSNDGDIGSLQFDTSGNAHVFFADGATPDYDLKHMMLSGGTWSSPVTVASVTDIVPSSGYVGSYCLVPGASGAMEAWYNLNGDKMRRVRDSGGTWAAAEVIQAADALDFVQASAVRNAHADLRTLFSEHSGWTGSDSDATPLGLYAYGDSGAIAEAIDMTAADPHWGDVKLLLNSRARNAATTIIDDSQSCWIPTLNGNAQISTAQTPFAGGASIRLDGTGDYLSLPDVSDFSMAGTDDVSIDLWFRMNETGRTQLLMSKRPTATNGEFALAITNTNKLQFFMLNLAGAAVVNITGPTTLTTGTWYFAEVSRISGTVYVFLNGGLEGSGAQSAAPAGGSQALLIGRDPVNTTRDFNGWIAEPRFTRAGRHSSAYAAPTTWHPRR